MTRMARPTWLSLLLLSALIPVGAACSPSSQDTEQAVLADCDRPDLPDRAVDSCLERARVMDETSPSPEMHSLVADLSRRGYGPSSDGNSGSQEGPPSQSYEQTSSDEPPSGDYDSDDQSAPDMSDDNGPPDDSATAPDMDQDAAAGDEPPIDDAAPDDQPPSDQDMSPEDNDPGPPDGPPGGDNGPPPQ